MAPERGLLGWSWFMGHSSLSSSPDGYLTLSGILTADSHVNARAKMKPLTTMRVRYGTRPNRTDDRGHLGEVLNCFPYLFVEDAPVCDDDDRTDAQFRFLS
jgi:hypothetical protein